MNLPIELYSASQIRLLEQAIYQYTTLTPVTLMEQAGAAVYDIFCENFPDAERVAVVCGHGNNGGDGFVFARLAYEDDRDVTVFTLGDLKTLPAAAKAAADACHMAGVPIHPLTRHIDLDVDVIVDAICGIGLRDVVQGDVLLAIDCINHSSADVLAIDVPSGIACDTGHVMGAAVAASITVTLLGLKQGLFMAEATEYVGELILQDLGIDAEVYADIPLTALRIDFHDCLQQLPRRARDAHKGDFGHVLVIAGDYGMPGAAILAGRAALCSGAGLVTVATRPEHVSAVIAAQPELMCLGVASGDDVDAVIARADVIVIGCGMTDSRWAINLFERALATDLPVVVDAGALQWLATTSIQRDNWVLTPHPGEAAALLGCSAADVQADRFKAALALQQKYDGVIVLKGAGTIVQEGIDIPEICHAGNPGMATAGTGDVLAGVIASLIAQSFSVFDAARAGVSFHAYAGDLAALDGERGMLASDVIAHLRQVVNLDTACVDDDAHTCSHNHE